MDDHDLLLVGAGALGSRIARNWRALFPGARITCETESATRHPALRESGFSVRLRNDLLEQRFPYVVMAVPPSKTTSYFDEAARAVKLWDRKGALLLISSTGVYAEDTGGWVEEDSEVAKSERAAILIGAEDVFLQAKSAVLRLAGLYAEDRGPHITIAKNPSSPLTPKGWINLIHYEDAAGLATSILQHGSVGTFLGVDDCPITRKDFAAVIGSSCEFLGTGPQIGKRCTNLRTRAAVQWTPKWKRFSDWWESR